VGELMLQVRGHLIAATGPTSSSRACAIERHCLAAGISISTIHSASTQHVALAPSTTGAGLSVASSPAVPLLSHHGDIMAPATDADTVPLTTAH
jgi:hypothetical protein